MKIFVDGPCINQYIKKIANYLNLKIVGNEPDSNHLLYNEKGLSYVSISSKNKSILHINFLKGSLGWRIKRSEHESSLKKAIGKHSHQLTIFDATAGQLNDSMIFLSLGHQVVAVEQSKILYLLVSDAIKRAGDELPILDNLKFINGNSIEIFKKDNNQFDLIYLDPMYPIVKKNVKRSGNLNCIKEILSFENLMNHGDNLIEDFMNLKCKKIILKRPLKSKNNYSNINYQIKGKAIRYDVFL